MANLLDLVLPDRSNEAIGPLSKLVSSFRQVDDRTLFENSKQAYLTDAAKRFRKFNTEESSQFADLIVDNPKAAEIMASQHGGFENMERRLTQGAALRFLSKAISEGGDAASAFQDGLDAGMDPQYLMEGFNTIQQQGLLNAQIEKTQAEAGLTTSKIASEDVGRRFTEAQIVHMRREAISRDELRAAQTLREYATAEDIGANRITTDELRRAQTVLAEGQAADIGVNAKSRDALRYAQAKADIERATAATVAALKKGKPNPMQTMEARKEFLTMPIVRRNAEIFEGLKGMWAAFEEATKPIPDEEMEVNTTARAQARTALATLLNKVLDPNSVVRESEFRIAVDVAGGEDTIRNWINNLLVGQALSDQQVENMMNLVANIAALHAETQVDLQREQIDVGKRLGFDTKVIAPDIVSGVIGILEDPRINTSNEAYRPRIERLKRKLGAISSSEVEDEESEIKRLEEELGLR